MAIGIVQITSKLLSGDIIDTCQKLKSIIGSVKIIAEIVKQNAVFISNIFGRKLNIDSIYF
ncbi:hypothetical protein GW891_02970 [bacterium]|nr:hypothetical protein [bacterium]